VIGYPQPSSLSPGNVRNRWKNASHVRNAAARLKQVKGVTEAERRAAWKRIQSAAERYGVELEKSDWREHTLHACHGSGNGTVRQFDNGMFDREVESG